MGSDPDEDDEELDEYEAEEGDQDDLPDEETLRLQLHKQWLKQQQVFGLIQAKFVVKDK